MAYHANIKMNVPINIMDTDICLIVDWKWIIKFTLISLDGGILRVFYFLHKFLYFIKQKVCLYIDKQKNKREK